MPRNTQPVANPGDTSLVAKVQAIRDEALNIARMQTISELISEKYNTKKSIKHYEEEVDFLEKQVKISDYKLSKLDEADPEYARKKEDLEAYNNADKDHLVAAKNRLEERKVAIANDIKLLDEKIAKFESGENQVAHIRVNALADEMIKNSYKS